MACQRDAHAAARFWSRSTQINSTMLCRSSVRRSIRGGPRSYRRTCTAAQLRSTLGGTHVTGNPAWTVGGAARGSGAGDISTSNASVSQQPGGHAARACSRSRGPAGRSWRGSQQGPCSQQVSAQMLAPRAAATGAFAAATQQPPIQARSGTWLARQANSKTHSAPHKVVRAVLIVLRLAICLRRRRVRRCRRLVKCRRPCWWMSPSCHARTGASRLRPCRA